MDLEPIRRGFVIGLSVAAPVGPIGVLVIQRSMSGALVGLATGLGAAVADALYALAGALATAFVARSLAHAWPIELLGAAFLAYLAVKTWRTPLAASVSAPPGRPTALLTAFAQTLLLTLANPATILSFAAIFAAVGLAASPSSGSVAALCGGVFLGSATWWLVLSHGVRWLAHRITPAVRRGINVVAGGILVVFAVAATVHAIRTALHG